MIIYFTIIENGSSINIVINYIHHYQLMTSQYKYDKTFPL